MGLGLPVEAPCSALVSRNLEATVFGGTALGEVGDTLGAVRGPWPTQLVSLLRGEDTAQRAAAGGHGEAWRPQALSTKLPCPCLDLGPRPLEP